MEKVKKIGVKIFMYVVMLFTIIVSIFPIIWVIMSAFKTNAQILSSPFSLPTSISFDAFVYIFEKYDFVQYFINSVLICVVSTLSFPGVFCDGRLCDCKISIPWKKSDFCFVYHYTF